MEGVYCSIRATADGEGKPNNRGADLGLRVSGKDSNLPLQH